MTEVTASDARLREAARDALKSWDAAWDATEFERDTATAIAVIRAEREAFDRLRAALDATQPAEVNGSDAALREALADMIRLALGHDENISARIIAARAALDATPDHSPWRNMTPEQWDRAALDATPAPQIDVERLVAAAQEVLAADGAIAREEAGADRRWDAALAELDGAVSASVDREEKP